MPDFDVVVIGGGLAGSMAALAARQGGARVALASRSWGATAMSTGAVDIAHTPALSPTQSLPTTIAEHVLDIIAHRKTHPYGVLGLERVASGVRSGFTLLQEALEGSDLALDSLRLDSENIGLPSALGAVLPAATAFLPHRGLDLHRGVEGHWGVAQFLGDTAFDARRLRLGLRQDAEAVFGRAPELMELPLTVRARPPLAMARALDDQRLVDSVAKELSGKARGLSGVIFPPVLGFERSQSVRETLAEAAGAKVVEALAHVPSVPGMRLTRELERAVQGAGVSAIGEVEMPRIRNGCLDGVVTSDRLEIGAGAVVLATGRFVAGGVVWTDRCKEALFGLPVVTDVGLMEEDSPHTVVRQRPVESHPLMTAGVAFNDELQPLREGGVAHQNLFAAGMVLGGFASRYVQCADGVALATGYLSGRAALEVNR